MNELLASISPSQAPQTRSKAAAAAETGESRKRKRDSPDGPSSSSSTPASPARAVPLMKETPLAELFVQGMSDEQIWAELELRAQGVCEMLNYALDGEIRDAAEDEEGEGAEDARGKELERMRQALIAEGFDPAELEGLDLDGMEVDEDSEEDDDEEDEDSEDDEESDESEDEDDGEDADLGEDVEELRDPSDEEELDVEEPSFLNGGKRTLKLKRKGGHPVLDDGFFNLAEFNAETEAAESKNVSRGRLSKDDEDDEDEDEDAESVDLFTPVDDPETFDEEDLENGGVCKGFFVDVLCLDSLASSELFYKDFFDPPTGISVPKAKKPSKAVDAPPSTSRVRFHEEVRVKKIKAKGKNLPVSTTFYEEEEAEEDDDDDEYEEGDESADEEDEDEEGEGLDDSEESDEDVSMQDEDDSGLATIQRLRDDLLADDEEEEQQGLYHPSMRIFDYNF